MKKIPWGLLILVFILVYIGALTIPYVAHKKVSSSFQESFAKRTFSNDSVGTERTAYIDDNVEALQYRLRMVEEAEEEIILSTFDFNADQAGYDGSSFKRCKKRDKGPGHCRWFQWISGLKRAKRKTLVSGFCCPGKCQH